MMSKELQIEKKRDGETLTISLAGELITTTAQSLRSVVDEGFDGLASLIFDFKDLEYLTSAGLRVLLLARQKTEDLGIEMKLRNVSDDIKQIFKTTGFATFLTIE